MKKMVASALLCMILAASVLPAFAGGRYSHGDSYDHRHHRSYGPLIGLGLFGLGFGLGRAYDPWLYRERAIMGPQVCGYEFGGYVWNPTWQRWDAIWMLVCR